MHFNIQYDHGTELAGYLIPDGFSEIGQFVVIGNGGVLYEGECDSVVESVLQVGRHETGVVGFSVNDSQIPGLADIEDLEIRDAKTDILIYCRENGDFVPKRLFRLETQLSPRVYLDKSLEPLFHYSATAIHHLGNETVSQLFHLEFCRSRYLSGRILIRNYEHFIGKNLVSVVNIQEPHYELALRILLLSQYNRMSVKFLPTRDEMSLQPAIDYFSDLNITDEKQVRRSIKKAPKDVLKLLLSPVVRQLVTKTPDEQVTFRSVSQALEMLSRFDLVTYDNGPVSIGAGIAELLDIPSKSIFDNPRKEAFSDFAKIIEDIELTDLLLESDLILFHYLKDSVEKAQELIQQDASTGQE